MDRLTARSHCHSGGCNEGPPVIAIAVSGSSTPATPLSRGDEIDPRPEILCYRGQTFAMVRHFFEISSQVGRLPSLLGREFFRARVSHHAIPSFEDQAVFVRDVELCFARLSEPHAEMITLVGLYSFSREEVAQMLRASRTWVNNRVAEALDALSEIFLQAAPASRRSPRSQAVAGDKPVHPGGCSRIWQRVSALSSWTDRLASLSCRHNRRRRIAVTLYLHEARTTNLSPRRTRRVRRRRGRSGLHLWAETRS